MALKFIGERTVGTLNGMKSGFVKDDLYRVYDAGILVPGGVSVDHGDFVSWDGTKWVREADIKIARSDEITNTNSSIAPDYTKKTYEANSYVMYGGVLYTNPSTINAAEDWNPDHWTATTVADMVNGGPLYVDKAVYATQQSANVIIELGQRQIAHCRLGMISGSNRSLQVRIASGTTDAILFINKNGQNSKISNFAIGGIGYGTVRAAGNIGLGSSITKYNLKYLIGPGSPMTAPTSLEQISVGSTEIADASYLDPALSDANFVFVQVIGRVVFYGGFKQSSMGGINPWPTQW